VADGPKPYDLDPAFELRVVLLCCCRPRFWGALGVLLDIQRITNPSHVLMLRAVRAIAKDNGAGPTEYATVAQRLKRWVNEGHVKHEEYKVVADTFADLGDYAPDEKEVAKELTPILRRIAEADVVRRGMDLFSKRGDFSELAAMASQVANMGLADRSIGGKIGAESLQRIAKLRQMERLPVGIPELDVGIGGGLPRGRLGLFAAGGKVGKTMLLGHAGCTALRLGLFVAYVTLEIGEGELEARILANLTGVPIDNVMDGSSDDEVTRRMALLAPRLGTFRHKFMPAKVTTCADIFAWVKEIEAEEGRPIDLLEVDYVDKMGASASALGKQDNTYQVQGDNAEELRLYVHGRGIYGWSASQAQRRSTKDRGKRLELDDLADSQNKARVVDLIVTATAPTEGEVALYVAGSRFSKGQFEVGPYLHDFASARVVQPQEDTL